MFCNLDLAKNSTTTKAWEKISTALFKNTQILNKINHRFLLTTKLFTGWKVNQTIFDEWSVVVFDGPVSLCNMSLNSCQLLLFPITICPLYTCCYVVRFRNIWACLCIDKHAGFFYYAFSDARINILNCDERSNLKIKRVNESLMPNAGEIGSTDRI